MFLLIYGVTSLNNALFKKNNPTEVKNQIPRDTLLNKVKKVRNNERLVLTLTYHPSIKRFQNVLNEVHILLTPNKEYRNDFEDKPSTIGWRSPNHLKITVSAKNKCEVSSDNKSAPCCRSRCQICSFIEQINTFQNKDKSKTFDIRNGILNYGINLVVYLIEYKPCSNQHVGSTIAPFRSSFNNYKSGLEKCQKFIPRNVMSIKNNLIVTLTLRNTMGWRTGRLLSMMSLKLF